MPPSSPSARPATRATPAPDERDRASASVDWRGLLHALAEDNRAEIVRLLVDTQLAVKQIVAATGLAQPLVSHHLKVLREAGLVESTICERLTVYRVRADTLQLLAEGLTAMASRASVTSGKPAC